MPPKPRPSDIASDCKRRWWKWIDDNYIENPPKSEPFDFESAAAKVSQDRLQSSARLRIAVIDGDPVDVALDWDKYEADIKKKPATHRRIPVVNVANEKTPGGDWESGLLAPEENLCRRSSLYKCLTKPAAPDLRPFTYPLPQSRGLYSPVVVVFRAGPNDNWTQYPQPKWLPVISVAPHRRPKLNSSGEKYTFPLEKKVMKDKIRGVLRIAAFYRHRDICVGAFGAGPICRNPAGEVARIWRNILFNEPEFQGAFDNIVFAIERPNEGSSSSRPSDHDVFKEELNAAVVVKSSYC